MRKLILLLSICAGVKLQAQTTPGRVARCISGDCKNGTGEALVTEVDNGSGQVWFRGTFKDGLLDGDGEMAGYGKYFIGRFKKGFKNGHFAVFGLKWDGDHPLPDSAQDAAFADYDGEYGFESIRVYTDGTTRNYSVAAKHHDHWDYDKKVKDEWVNNQVAAFLAARAGKFTVREKTVPAEMILAVRKANTARDQWIEAIQWDCLADRQYYITMEAQTKYHALPFAGHLTMQVVAPDNTVAYEGELGNYWKPRTDGKYTFLIKFYQDKILGGDGSNYVDGLRIEWTLHSKRP